MAREKNILFRAKINSKISLTNLRENKSNVAEKPFGTFC